VPTAEKARFLTIVPRSGTPRAGVPGAFLVHSPGVFHDLAFFLSRLSAAGIAPEKIGRESNQAESVRFH
jgi:hypothetical protein